MSLIIFEFARGQELRPDTEWQVPSLDKIFDHGSPVRIMHDHLVADGKMSCICLSPTLLDLCPAVSCVQTRWYLLQGSLIQPSRFRQKVITRSKPFESARIWCYSLHVHPDREKSTDVPKDLRLFHTCSIQTGISLCDTRREVWYHTEGAEPANPNFELLLVLSVGWTLLASCPCRNGIFRNVWLRFWHACSAQVSFRSFTSQHVADFVAICSGAPSRDHHASQVDTDANPAADSCYLPSGTSCINAREITQLTLYVWSVGESRVYAITLQSTVTLQCYLCCF